MFRLLSGIFMGWTLGSNDSANVFGPAVAAKSLRFWTAAVLCSLFVITGAWFGGLSGMKTLGSITKQTMDTAFVASVAAALTVFLMTVAKQPVSTSQAVVGAIVGIALPRGDVNYAELLKICFVWVGTPVGALVLSFLLYPVLGKLLNCLRLDIFTRDKLLKWANILAGCYAAYSLGANNVANVTGIYLHTGLISREQALLLGGFSIAVGVLTFSKQVMLTVGRRLVRLDPYSAFIAVFSQAILLDFYARLGVPTSSSQAIIGAVLGIGLFKGANTINPKALLKIFVAWIGTPAVALGLAYGLQGLL